MKVSLNAVRQFIDFELPPIDELVEGINQQLGGVEEVIDLGDKYKDAVIVRVVECEKHPNADKLSVCKIDIGIDPLYSKFHIPNSDHLVEVVCGAPNVHADMWAIWLPPGATVPASYGDQSPFVLDVRDIRGVRSHGMLAAADELAIGSDHSGIIELTDNDLHPKSKIQNLKSGQNFAEVFDLNDTIIDIENKMFTHRPDLFGQLGVAREIAGIQGKQFSSPEWYVAEREEVGGKREDEPQSAGGDDALPLTVVNDAENVVPRFMAVVMRDVTVQPSPFWLQCELVRLGSKPINNIVDVTNYVMLLTAQPTHAYDYDKLRASTERREEKTLGTRFAQKGETITLLNGKTYELDESDIVIVDGEGPVGLGGIMGGGNSEVSDTTKNVVLECANFDMYAIRKSSMRHGLFTDAVTRFNKGQSPLQNPVVLNLLMMSVIDVAGGEKASEVFDVTSHGSRDMSQDVEISSNFINDRLGLTLQTSEISDLLKNVEFDIVPRDSYLVTRAPFWRTDIEQPEDIVEEVGRLYGFDKLPRELPTRSIQPAPKNPTLETKRKIRDALSRAGANEVLTYSFVHEKIMQRAEQDVSQAFQLSNALSPDLQYYRLSVLPSLLDRVHANIKSGHDEFVLYEIGKGHNKKFHADDDEGLPAELEFVDAVYASKSPHEGAAYYRMHRLVTSLCQAFGFEVRFKPITEPLDFPVTAPFDQSRSALVEATDGTFIGMIGELKSSVIRAFKLPSYTAAMTLDLDGLQTMFARASSHYTPLSRYPSITQDISLRVATEVDYQALLACVRDALDAHEKTIMTESLSPLSIYQPRDSHDTKTITFRIKVTSQDRTLTDADASALLDGAADLAKIKLNAERV